MHAGVLMKLGAYGVLRIGFGLLPEATVAAKVRRVGNAGVTEPTIREATPGGAPGATIQPCG